MTASTLTAVHELVRERWSPRALADAPISTGDLRSLLEAAQWAASSMNEQPWRFIVADRYRDAELYARVLSTLVPANAGWARRAPVLMVVAARTAFTHNGAPNRHALYDTGAAVAQLTIQATSLGLRVHQMGGFRTGEARTVLGIPDGFEPVVVLAVGYPGDAGQLPDELRAREQAPRRRHPLGEVVFEGAWGKPWSPDGNQ